MSALFASLLFLSSFISPQDTLELTTEIDQVTVFKNRAQIERSAEVQLKEGTTKIVFTDLSEYLVPESIQLKGNGSYTLLSLTNRTDFREEHTPRADLQKLEEERDELIDQRTIRQADLEVVNSEIELLRSTQNIINNNKLSSMELSQLLSYYRENLSRLLKERNGIQNDINELNSRIRLLNQKINESGVVKRTRFKEVVAEVRTDLAQPITFTLNYLVSNAGWRASYDLRSENTDSPLELSYRANIYQNTGVDWDQVAFTINSGDPSSNSTKPELNPAYVGFYQPPVARTRTSVIRPVQTDRRGVIEGRVYDAETGENIPGTTLYIPELDRRVATDNQGNFQITGIPNGTYTLRATFVGYVLTEVPVRISNNGLMMNLPMAADVQGLDELVVTGYALEESKEPFSVQLRGNSSINAATNPPLYVIDGIMYEGTDQFQSLDPDDIASIEILKDTEAAQLYGERSAGGVVVVTTKNGSSVSNELVSNQTSFSYELSLPYSVPSDGKDHAVEIKRESVSTDYQFSTVPKLSSYAYLVGNIPDWSSLNLIEGEANIYFDNSFVGTTYLNPASLEDTLQLSLGKDERIVVEREKLNEFSSKNFFRNRVREYHSYEIRIRNTKSEPITIRVEDQIPVSTNEEIKVTPKELSNGTHDKGAGIVHWNLTIEPGNTRTLRLDFEIEYPKGKRINF